MENISSSDDEVDIHDLITLCCLHDGSQGQLYSQLSKLLVPLKDDPVFVLLTIKESDDYSSIEELFDKVEFNNDPEVCEIIVIVATLLLYLS